MCVFLLTCPVLLVFYTLVYELVERVRKEQEKNGVVVKPTPIIVDDRKIRQKEKRRKRKIEKVR